MGICFIIQPFDNGPFDKRYEDIIEPAIKECGLEPYRVDKDPYVNIPIDDIQSGIGKSDMCVIDITTDNPNVWFELGYAIAINKDVILICSNERKTPFPFDIQHRRIIRYATSAPRDFEELKSNIKQRINAIIEKRDKIGAVTETTVVNAEGLSQYEIVALVSIAGNTLNPDAYTTMYSINEDMNKAGFNKMAISLAMRKLYKKGMIIYKTEEDQNGNLFYLYALTEAGEKWLINNEDQLILKTSTKNNSEQDDTPF